MFLDEYNMAISIFRKGFRICSSYPKLSLLTVVYINASIWLMSRDLNNQWMNSDSMMSSQHRYPKYNDKSFSKDISNFVSDMFVPKENAGVIRIRHLDNDKQTVDESGYTCSMAQYLSYTTDKCQPQFNDLGLTSVKLFPKSENNNLAGNSHVLGNKQQDVYSQYHACDVNNVFFNCDTLRNSYMYGKHTVTAEEELFPLVFAMKIHKSANQAHRLLRYIYQKHNLYCIHVDKKAPAEIFFQFLEIGKCLDNVIVIRDRVNVVYSTIRQLEAEFKCMDMMIKHDITWKYYINLTGEEFMLKTNLEIVKILKFLNGTNDIESTFLPPNEYHKINQKTAIMGNYPFVTKQKKQPFNKEIRIRKGSAYGMFSREFVQFVITDKFVKKFIDWLKDAYAPEELIWATLNNIPGTPGGHVRIVSGDSFLSRAVKWQMDGKSKCGGKYVRWVCVYGTKDLPWLLKHPNIVANKFYGNFEPMALGCLENVMYSRMIASNNRVSIKIEDYRKLLSGGIHLHKLSNKL